MQPSIFFINNRFSIDKTKNEIYDKEKGERHRIEPRLMKLLCLLVEQQGKVLARETMLKEIWDNYPGGNDGLNQAISFLRKLLGDEHKEIIATLPKKGYIFNGIISHTPIGAELKGRPVLVKLAFPFMAVLIAFIIIWSYFHGTRSSPTQPTDQTPELLRRLSNIDAQRDSISYNNDSASFRNSDSAAFKNDSIRQAKNP